MNGNLRKMTLIKTVYPAKSYTSEFFYDQMDKSGRITIPALTRNHIELYDELDGGLHKKLSLQEHLPCLTERVEFRAKLQS